LASTYKRVNAIVKEREKDILKLLSGKERVHFSAMKCCVNVQKAMSREKTEERVVMQINANNLHQRKFFFMKHPWVAGC
jgi:hypothetical protein